MGQNTFNSNIPALRSRAQFFNIHPSHTPLSHSRRDAAPTKASVIADSEEATGTSLAFCLTPSERMGSDIDITPFTLCFVAL